MLVKMVRDVNMVYWTFRKLMRRVRPQRRVLPFCPDCDFAVSVQICTDYVDCAVYSFILARNVPRIIPSPRVSYRTSESHDLWSPFYEFTECTVLILPVIECKGRGTAMNAGPAVTGRLIAAARALTGISAKDLATTSGVSIETLRQMEASGGAWLQPGADLDAVKRALETFGAIFIPESEGIGAGVRLKFLRQDVRQIGRLETEGGIVADDDVP